MYISFMTTFTDVISSARYLHPGHRFSGQSEKQCSWVYFDQLFERKSVGLCGGHFARNFALKASQNKL